MARWHYQRALSEKPQGQVWLVRSEHGRTGYFKFVHEDQWPYAGPFIANEFITAALARRLGFPVAALEVADVAGPDGIWQHGIVSIAATSPEVLPWADAPPEVRRRPEAWLRNVERLCQLVVFDAWTVNVDRATDRNLILHRDHGDSRYDWYLIDHSLCLLGAPYKWASRDWRDPYWMNLWKYHHVPEGLLRLQSDWRALRPMVERIQQLSRSVVDEAIATAPAGSLPPDQARQTRNLLLYRQRHLERIIRLWLAHPGVKEYRPH
ncbi:hypothetical protein [Alicyclobacillus sp.]|uniref:hypothetical protein n=1 Tax=Alicyclobacillus sp. TaxID=61169 RepID=UPI0025B997A3|nr:hypothetical protein [Alicyclobacillus sp.]MCL6517285.1 hypothetical protein [Alicyclobacillus sp.]